MSAVDVRSPAFAGTLPSYPRCTWRCNCWAPSETVCNGLVSPQRLCDICPLYLVASLPLFHQKHKTTDHTENARMRRELNGSMFYCVDYNVLELVGSDRDRWLRKNLWYLVGRCVLRIVWVMMLIYGLCVFSWQHHRRVYGLHSVWLTKLLCVSLVTSEKATPGRLRLI